jgi:hypothetical protein
MKVLKSFMLALTIVSVVLSDEVVKDNVVKLNTTQPIKPKPVERKSSKYAKIKAAREAAERKLKELAAELEALKSAEKDDFSAPAPSPSSSLSAPAPASLKAPVPDMGLTVPAPSQTEKAVKSPSSEVVDMDEVPKRQQSKRRRVVKKVRSTDKKIRSKQDDWNEAHHDVHEYDNSHWVEVDGEMTRLHIKSQNDVVDDLLYHGSEDTFAETHGHQGHKIPDHRISKTKKRTNIKRRPRRKTDEELHGGYDAPKPTFFGMWSGENLDGGIQAPGLGVYGGNKYKQEM